MGGDRRSILPAIAISLPVLSKPKPNNALGVVRAAFGGERHLCRCLHALAFYEGRRAQLQKKACSPKSRNGLTWQPKGAYGGGGSIASMPNGRYSSMNRGGNQHGTSYGWGPKGKRVKGFAPHGHWKTPPSLAGFLLGRHRANGRWMDP